MQQEKRLLWEKKYKSKAYIGDQKHLLECSKKNKGQLKLKSFLSVKRKFMSSL